MATHLPPQDLLKNVDEQTVRSFGDEWKRFDQGALPPDEALAIFREYFSIFPWDALPRDAEGFDMGCGSGRWAAFVAPRVGRLHCVDPSDALEVARKGLAEHCNITFHSASVADTPLPASSQDFGYSLGVLHHVPDTAAAIRACVEKLKPGAPFLLYLYYAFDNRSTLYKLTWKASDLIRRVVCRLPPAAKHLVTDAFAVSVYYPLARLALLMERLGLAPDGIPLAYYRHHSFYTMRTDSRDRFGTPLERRFSRTEIARMMEDAGLRDIRFSEHQPYWCAVGTRI